MQNQDALADHAEQARRCQWKLQDLPWDEPIEFQGSTKRERMLCALDLLDVSEVLYHFELGARIRMGDHLARAWSDDDVLAECLEWHDVDGQRHVAAFRRMIAKLRSSTTPMPNPIQRVRPERMWRVTYSSRERLGDDRLFLNLLVDEAVAHCLYDMVGRRSHVPLLRALAAACAEDAQRHVDYLLALEQTRCPRRSNLRVNALQASVVGHIINLQGAFRPHLASFSGACHTTNQTVAADLLGAISKALGSLGMRWRHYPIARLIHSAERSPWFIWFLR